MTITLDPASELARALAASDEHVVVVSEDIRFTVEREDILARYDPQTVLDGLRQSRGALRGVNTEALLADLAGQREQDSIGRPA